MIPADAHLEVAWLDPTDLVHPPQPLNLGQVQFYADLMADTDGHLAPVLVNPPDSRGRYTIRDGRHRTLAHLALGRERIRCIVVKEP